MLKRKGFFLDKGTIVIERDLTSLDMFVKKFLDVLKKYSDYLVVSGYVSISTGRTRGTEDVDIITPIIKIGKFRKLFNELDKEGFWCYQGDTPEEAYNYFSSLTSIRFALKKTLFPNIEFIPFDKTKKAKSFEFEHPFKLRIKGFEFKIPPLEFEILYKEIVLKGKKDIEDAKHLRVFFSDIIKKEKFEEYLPIIRSELK